VIQQPQLMSMPIIRRSKILIFIICSKMTSRIPPLLEPYLTLPSEASLILITSVLGASSNWLVLRFLYSALLEQDSAPEFSSGEDTKVLLVSFMRDLGFWKENARRLVSQFHFSQKSRSTMLDRWLKVLSRVSILINLPRRRDLLFWMA
jgi:hypothetical protein